MLRHGDHSDVLGRLGSAGLMLLTIFLSVSPVVSSVSGVTGNYFFLLGCAILLAKPFSCFDMVGYRNAVLVLLIVLCAFPAAIYWGDPLIVFYPIYLLLSVLVCFFVSKKKIFLFSRMATWVLVFISIGAWIGVAYAFLGGVSNFSIENPDGRESYFYLSTFSNWTVGNFIRPSGVFDEPGALSFVICIISALRHKLRQPKNVTWALLFMGLVTTSIAHVVYMLFHALQDRKYLLSKGWLLFVFLVPCVVALNFSYKTDNSDVFFSRFEVVDGRLSGDSRSKIFYSAQEKIGTQELFFGIDGDCIVRPKLCENKGYDVFGETPAGVVLQFGVILSAPYFIILIWFLVSAINYRDFVCFGLFLILLQRPYVMSYGYSLLIVLVVLADKFSPPNCARSLVAAEARS